MSDTHSLNIVKFFIVLTICWLTIIAAFLMWSVNNEKGNVHNYAANEARAAIKKDIIYRHWSAAHGGTYVPVTKNTPPNPYLVDVVERDISTPSGKKLTLVNPAYMTRQVYELGRDEYDSIGHITSLNPIRPANKPDDWEAESLKAFEKGASENMAVKIIEGVEYLRLMQPLIVQKACLKCHAKQGYAEGDIRGGLSISVLLTPYKMVADKHIRKMVLIHTMIALFGVIGLVACGYLTKQKELDKALAVKALMESEEKFRNLVESSNDWIWEVDIDGKYTYASPQVENILGYPAEEIIGKTPFDLMEPVEANRIAAIFKDTLQKKAPVISLQNINLHKNGQLVILETSGVPIFDKDKNITHYRGVDRDITPRIEADKKLKEKQRQYNQLLDDIASSTILFSHNDNGVISYISPSIKNIIGVDQEEVIGKFWHEIMKWDAESLARGKKEYEALMKGKKDSIFDMSLIDPKGNCRTFHINSHLIYGYGEAIVGVEGTAIDITERKQAEIEQKLLNKQLKEEIANRQKTEEKLRILAKTDELTGVNNRREFMKQARFELARARRYNKRLSVLMIDIDHFKLVNDNYGHDAGDLVLTIVANTLVEQLRENDHFGRLGGEEFAAILVETDHNHAFVIAERLRNVLENKKIFYKDHQISVTVSIGISVSASQTQAQAQEIETLLKNADDALYKAKMEGRNQVCCLDI